MIKLALALWITTHTITVEIPLTANFRKPLNCQLCLAGWICIGGWVVSLVYGKFDFSLEIIACWGLSVLIEALYSRLTTIII